MSDQKLPLAQPSQSEVREVLQYVPIFSGQTFVVVLDGKALPDTTMAEVLLDLISLQKIGVHLVIVYTGDKVNSFLDWAAEVELKLSEVKVDSVLNVLSRGQAALVRNTGEFAFNESLVELAEIVSANKVLYLGKITEYPREWTGALNARDAKDILDEVSGVSQCVLSALSKGVGRVHLLDGSMPGCLSRELFSNEGVGVMIYRDYYQEIRPLSEEDIPELLAIIGRSIRSQHLLPRSYEELENHLEDYFVMAIDGNVVGSVALHSYEDGLCELACLFVKESHKGLGYGHQLVKHVEGIAKGRNFSKVFALSTAAGGFFERQLDYQQSAVEEIPRVRQEKLKLSGRSSVVLMKELN